MKIKNIRILTAATLAISFIPAWSQGKPANITDLKYSIQDNEIVYPESFSTDTQKLLERWYLKNYTTSGIGATSDTDPGATDKQIKERLAALPTVIEMPFNSIVKQYIERYTKKGRKQVTALLGLSSYYMPIFEQALEEAGLPLELKYLPVIESGLDPNATSKSGAAGLWQFMLIAARGYDMEVTSLVDERRDPYISSERACRLLKDLYNTYGDWSLAIAAYNCGPSTVNKALTRAGGDPNRHDFWSIYNYLPTETRGYVPMFIAANYVMTYYPEHGIAPVLATKPLITDTVHLSDRVHFEQISAILDIPVEEIRILNPQFRADIIPASAAHPYNLILPSQQIHAYIVSEDQILDYEKETYARRIEATPGEINPAAAGARDPYNADDLALIEAEAAELVYEQVNPVQATEAVTPRRRRTEAGAQAAPAAGASTSAQQRTETKPQPTQTASAGKTNSKSNTKSNKSNGNATGAKKKAAATPKDHTVTSGENLTVIAKKHGVSVEALKKANPNINADKIHPGDKINLPSKKNSNSKTASGSKTSTKKGKKR